jgi:hypothetical protein
LDALADTSQNTMCEAGATVDALMYSGNDMLQKHGGRQGHSFGWVGRVHVYVMLLVVVAKCTCVSTTPNGLRDADHTCVQLHMHTNTAAPAPAPAPPQIPTNHGQLTL